MQGLRAYERESINCTYTPQLLFEATHGNYCKTRHYFAVESSQTSQPLQSVTLPQLRACKLRRSTASRRIASIVATRESCDARACDTGRLRSGSSRNGTMGAAQSEPKSSIACTEVPPTPTAKQVLDVDVNGADTSTATSSTHCRPIAASPSAPRTTAAPIACA
eukprot:3378066-Pleurochrysis_carterae.AAC.1